MKKFFNYTIKVCISILLFSTFLIFSAFWYFSYGLPDYKKLSNYEPSVLSRVYAESGELIGEFAIEKRLFIPFNSIPDKVINSFLSAEDKNFFDHPGIDAKGVTRAVIKNIDNILSNKRLEGASTITQQVAKNFLLTNEVSLKRKIKEAILAFRIEKAYSKKRILELYLNEIYLGKGTYGVASASLEYFNKSVKELNYNEAALLAALPKAPSKYNPYNSIEKATVRRNMVLKNLNDNGYISNDELQKFLKQKINLKKRKVFLIKEAKSYTEEVRRIVKTDYGFEKLYSEGLSISTPLDGKYQIAALNSLRFGIEKYDKRHGWRGPISNIFKDKNWKNVINDIKIDETLNWEIVQILKVDNYISEIKFIDTNKIAKMPFENLEWTRKKDFIDLFEIGDLIFVKKTKSNIWTLKQLPLVNGGIVVMDPHNGKVKALVGGYSFKSSEFNRVTQAKRQPGSAFKPIVYASALENGFLPNSLILDAPFVSEQGVGLKDWKPENYGKKFYGPSTLRKGIEKSRNLMTVRIAQKLGFDKISKTSVDLGVYENVPELLSVSLGSNETTLLKLTNAYCTFANGGKKITPILINRIQNRRGKTIYNSETRICEGCSVIKDDEDFFPIISDKYKQVISEQTAYQITSMLEGVIKRGTGKKLKNLNVPLAGKTGTTNEYFDAWFIGFTSDLAIGVYIGYDTPKSLGKFETGSKTALPIFKKFVESAIYKEEMKPFKIPKNIYFFPVDYDTGEITSFSEAKAISESFKENSLKEINLKNLGLGKNYDKFRKFRRFY
ncbi:MAG: PBP1A family penicillin-binding protein [Pelagibacteraceae bacterium]|nr:PBP1A family penicillin-binding protein [Pelagibacteraceae bacterium]